MKKYHEISEIAFEGDFLVLVIDGEKKTFPLKKISPLLDKASAQERSFYEISPSGYGIHWPLLDEDISIDGLLGIFHVPQLHRKVA